MRQMICFLVLVTLLSAPAFGQLVHRLAPESWVHSRSDNYHSVKIMDDLMLVAGKTQLDGWNPITGEAKFQIPVADTKSRGEGSIVPHSIWTSSHGFRFVEATRNATTIRQFEASGLEQTSIPLDLENVYVSCVAWSHDGTQLALAGIRNDQPVIFLVFGDRLQELPEPKGKIIQMLFTSDSRQLILLSENGPDLISLLDLATGQIGKTSGAFISRARFIDLTPDGRTIVVAGIANKKSSLLFLNSQTLRLTEGDQVTMQELINEPVDINSLAVSADGKLVIASIDEGVIIVDIESRTKVGELRGIMYPDAVAVSNDGEWLASVHSRKQVAVWQWKTVLKELMPIKTLNSHPVGDRKPQLRFSPTGSLLALTCANESQSDEYNDLAVVAGAAADDMATSSETKSQPVAIILIDPMSGDLSGVLATNSYQHLNLPSRSTEYVKTIKYFTNLAFSPDGKRLAAGGSSGYSHVLVWDLQQQQLEHVEKISGDMDELTFDPTGRFLWVADYYQSFNFDSQQGWKATELKEMGGSTVDFSPDGQQLFVGLTVFNPKTLAELYKVPNSQSKHFRRLSCDSTGRYAYAFYEQKVLRWDLENGVTDMPLVFHNESSRAEVLDCVLSPNSQVLAVSTDDAKIRLWNTATCQLVVTLVGHEGPANSIDFSPDSNTLASAGIDGTTRLWNVQPLTSLSGAAPIAPRKLPTNVVYHLSDGVTVKVVFDRHVSQGEVESALEAALQQLRSQTPK